jgi:hypothetical protein
MKGYLLFLLVFLAGCAQSGYNPSYIISEVEQESYVEPAEDLSE